MSRKKFLEKILENLLSWTHGEEKGYALFSLLLASFNPSLEGLLTFPWGPPQKDILHANIFIQVRPMDSFPFPNKPPMAAFLGGPLHQSWIPGNGHRDRPPIGEVDHEAILGNLDMLDCRRRNDRPPSRIRLAFPRAQFKIYFTLWSIYWFFNS